MTYTFDCSLSRYKLKFSPDKIDTMIVQAVCLLDDLDKELNNYIMRCREWYGWHFPELGKIVTDNVAFVKTVKLIGVLMFLLHCNPIILPVFEVAYILFNPLRNKREHIKY